MKFEDMVARIKATKPMPDKDINDNLFGHVQRPTFDGRDWLEHLDGYAENGDAEILDRAVELALVTLVRTPGICVDYTVNVLDFEANLAERLESAG